jgi:HAD superfamily hydrolase (TIGR01509 family)
MQIPHAVIFDFDGVVVATERSKFAWLKHVLKHKGHILRKDDFARMTGKKTAAFLKERFGDKLSPKEMHMIRAAWRRERLRNIKEYSRPIPGAIPFITQLRNRGVSLCLATGTERVIVRKALRLLGLNKAFQVLITGNECKLSKPNPQVYTLAIKALGMPAKGILVIEDSAAGVLAAKRAGLRCIAITTTQSMRELGQADVIVSSFRELEKKLFK